MFSEANLEISRVSRRGSRASATKGGVNGLETSGVAKFRPANVDRTRVLIAIPQKEQSKLDCRLGERVRVER